jgi:hypothetical protein
MPRKEVPYNSIQAECPNCHSVIAKGVIQMLGNGISIRWQCEHCQARGTWEITIANYPLQIVAYMEELP